MSRIEEALNKAAQRNVGQAPSSRPRPGPIPLRQPLVDPSTISNDKLVVLKTPASPEAEEFRKLKEALLKAVKTQEAFDNVILVTSPGQGEGKSLITVNLALSLAQEFDHTVLLVDADLRMPTCHRYLDIPSGLGLVDCLVDGVDLEKVLVKTGYGKLVLLPAGKPVKNPMEYFSSNTMRQLIEELKNRYPDRIILIDTPPVLMFAETRTLAGLADNVILVVREGDTSLEDIQESMNLLNNKVLGVVYNATEFVQHSQYPYYYYTSCPA